MENIVVLNKNTSIKDYMEEIISTKENDDSFYVMDIGVIYHQFNLWKTRLPTVQPHYAVKCNDSRMLLETLKSLGVNFDCASKDEIQKAIKVGAKPHEIIFANPSKLISHLTYAAEEGVSLMTFDSPCELQKIKKHYPTAKLVLRIKVDAAEGSCLISFGGKFGCRPDSAMELIQCAVDLGLEVVGISFHVGTGCEDIEAYARGIHIAAEIFKNAREEGIFMNLLDIGGGFPGDSTSTFEKIADSINEALEEEQYILKDLNIIAEPGRFFGCKAFTLATCITSLREMDTHNVYFINNGTYTSFNCVLTEKTRLQPQPFQVKDSSLKKSVIWGQTMEEFDKVVEECWLPEMKPGEWLYFTCMGAYSTCLSNEFYGYSVPKVYPVIHEEEWELLKMTRKEDVIKS